MHRNTAHGSGIQPIQLSTGSVKKQSPLHFIVMSTYVDRFLQYLALVYWDNMQEKKYWVAHLTYLMLLHYLGKINY